MNEERAEPRWLSRPVVLAIHDDQIRTHGGGAGLRDKALLESALDRPRNLWHYAPGADLAQIAAAYGYGIVRNHPFTDGNKRVAFLAIYVFLGLNGQQITAPEPDVVALMVGLAAGSTTEEDLTDWLRANIRPW